VFKPRATITAVLTGANLDAGGPSPDAVVTICGHTATVVEGNSTTLVVSATLNEFGGSTCSVSVSNTLYGMKTNIDVVSILRGSCMPAHFHVANIFRAADIFSIRPMNIDANTVASVTIVGSNIDSDIVCEFSGVAGTSGLVMSTSVVVSTPSLSTGIHTVACSSSEFGDFPTTLNVFVGFGTTIGG